MRQKKKYLISVAIPMILGIMALLFSLSTCQKFEPEGFLFFTTDTVETLGGGSYQLYGNIEDLGEEQISDHGFCWSEQHNPTTAGSTTHLNSRNTRGAFSSTILGLPPNTTFYYRAFVETSTGIEYANEKSFVTEADLPSVTTQTIEGITETSALSGGNVTDDGGAAITARGVCWSTSPNPTISDEHTSDGTGLGSYSSAITGLSCATDYYVRAYATNAAGTAYGSQLQFNTGDCPDADPPTVTTTTVGSVTQTSAQGGGNITDDGGAAVTAKGICWSTSPNPTTDNEKTNDGTGTGSYTSAIFGLTCGTTYYVRAYAINAEGTSYGNQVEFTTSQCTADPPTVTTATVTGVTETTAQGGGDVTDDGGASVTEKGICWSTSPDPTTSDEKNTAGTGTGSFTSAMTGLTCGTTYYVRAYAINSSGTSYGNQEEFTTNPCLVAPTVTTAAITDITDNSAQGGGEVTDDGGAAVTAKGVCWSTSPNPTIADDLTNDGTGTGSFTSSLLDLKCNELYYVRAYATNSVGTSYGDQVEFTTDPCPGVPTVTTADITNITMTSAQGGGNVTEDGGATVTARGVCYSNSPNPTLSDVFTTDGAGTGSFTSSIDGLKCGGTYYVRAYATNSVGTAYGEEVEFNTELCALLPTVTTSSIAFVDGNSAQGGGAVTDDGGDPVTARGVCWSTSWNPTIDDDKTFDGTGTGSFRSALLGLSPLTRYYVRAYATNAVGTAYGSNVSFTTTWDNSKVTDIDGNEYGTVQIGKQIWMTENLKTTRYHDGADILLVDNDSEWETMPETAGAYCWYDNNPANKHTYGALYNYAAVMNGEASSDENPSGIQGVCPVGWHIPSDSEWMEMEMVLGMDPGVTDDIGWRGYDEGGKLKAVSTLWVDPNVGATNESGFFALPGGWRHDWGLFTDIGKYAVFWTTTEYTSTEAWHRNLLNNYQEVYRNFYDKRGGFSVRCLRD